MIEELRLPTDLVVGELVRLVRARDEVLRVAVGAEYVRRATVLVESARAESLRERVVDHGVGRDVPGEVGAALEARLGVFQVLRIEVEVVDEAAAGGIALLEAEEAAGNTA